MERPIRMTALLALIFQVAFIGFGRFLLPLLATTTISMLSLEGEYAYLAMTFASAFLYLIIYVLFFVLLVYASKNRGEKIGMEIACIVVIGVVLPLLQLIVTTFERLYLTSMRGADWLATYNVMASAASILSFVSSASFILLVISATISICRKKFVIPLEYEKGYEINDEYNTQEYDNMGMFS